MYFCKKMSLLFSVCSDVLIWSLILKGLSHLKIRDEIFEK